MTRTPSIAFFDMDGTITDRDIFWDLIRYRQKHHGLSGMRLLSCAPAFARYVLGTWTNEQAKEHIFGILFKGEDVAAFSESIRQYTKDVLPSRLRKEAMDRISWHQQNGDEVYVVSANFDLLLQYFVSEYHLKLICTRLGISNNVLTGSFSTPNCYGDEKVTRIRNEVTDLATYTNIYCYGDSKGDLPMLDIATYRFYKPFRPE